MNLKSILELPNVYKRPEVAPNFNLLSFGKEKKEEIILICGTQSLIAKTKLL